MPDENPEFGSHPRTSTRLLELARQGRASAFSGLFRRHFPYLTRYAHGRIPPWGRTLADTQDVVQVAFQRLFHGLSRFELRGHGALRAYMRKAVDNLIRDEFRRIGRRGAVEALDEGIPDPAASPFDEAVSRETESRYRAALSRLRPADQQLIVGHVELGYSNEQLAILTGKRRADSARVALARALHRLADEMSSEGA